jgi:hypothetical protein
MDKKAVNTLVKTMTKSQKNHLTNWYEWETYMQYISREDFIYAKENGIMFDQEKIPHNDICQRIKSAMTKIEKKEVVDAFLYSLSTRDLKYRSFLASYCIGKSLAEHEFETSPKPNERICAVCGLEYHEFENPIDFNIINYFKYKSGSCSDNLIAVMFDLEQFTKFPRVKPNEEDYEILIKIKEKIENADASCRIAQLNKNVSKTIQSNEEERLGIIETLGIIGILHDNQHFGYADKYVTYLEREHTSNRFDDVGYPARWWQGKFGVDLEKWDYWFGKR